MSVREAVDVGTLRTEVFEAAVAWVDDAPAAASERPERFSSRSWHGVGPRSGPVVVGHCFGSWFPIWPPLEHGIRGER